MNRATLTFLVALVCSTAMLAAAWAIRPGIDGSSVIFGMLRFVLVIGGAAAMAVVWATAVFAAVHHVAWPLVVALMTVVGSTVAFVLS